MCTYETLRHITHTAATVLFYSSVKYRSGQRNAETLKHAIVYLTPAWRKKKKKNNIA